MFDWLQCVLILILASMQLNGIPFKAYYWSTRTLVCTKFEGHDTARCALHKEDSNLEINPECFENTEHNDTRRVYCRILCEESEDTTVLAKIPTWNHHCNMFYTYNLQRFRKDWYLWRSEECLNTTISLEVRCGFEADPRNFYTKNEQLFLNEDELDKRDSLKVT